MRTRFLRAGALALVLLLAAAGSSPAQDFRVLKETRARNPEARPPVAPLSTAGAAARVLLAGDSWAQYMWDDGSHADVFDRFGHQDKLVVSVSLGEDPGPGYTGPGYAVSGSEARQWADTADYPWIANMTAALAANPTIDLVMLSIGGNDVLAGRSDGGWYKDMDLDVPGSEAALFDRIEDDTFDVIDAALAVRPELRVLLSSYDYPNFNVGWLWCWYYACPKREDLSRDPVTDLITDEELNQMMVTVEGYRIGWTNFADRVDFDHAVGLMHHHYGDGSTPPGLLPHPGQTPPMYAPFPGGNALLPTLRTNFREPGGLDADPIHLDYEGYQLKIMSQTQTHFFPHFRGESTETFAALGGVYDGWTDGSAMDTTGIVLGDNGAAPVRGILTFDTSSIPDGAEVTAAAFYLVRSGGAGTNPFTSGHLGTPTVDVRTGTFGAPELEVADASAAADAGDAGALWGSARENGYAVRVELSPAGLAAVNDGGLTQFRVSFPSGGVGGDYVVMHDGDGGAVGGDGWPTLADYMGSSAPFLDVAYRVPTGVADGDPVGGAARVLSASPNPFGPSTSIRFTLNEPARVTLRVFDVAGRLVATLHDGYAQAGSRSVTWDGRDDAGRRVPRGIYLARLDDGRRAATTRLVRR